MAAKKKVVKKKPAAKEVSKKAVKLWTKAEISTLKKDYPKTATKALATKLKRTIEAVRFQAKKNGLKKTKTYMASLHASARKPAAKKATKKKASTSRKR